VIPSLARPYLAVAGARFRLLLQYRAAALAGFITQCWWGAVKIMVLAAFFSGSATTPMTLRQTIDYIWRAQAFLRLIPWSVDPEVTRMVRTGDVLYERLRPVDAHTFWSARAVALRTASPLLRAIPMILLAGVLFPLIGLSEWRLSPPAGMSAALFFAGSMVLVVALAAAISTILDIVTVATLSDRGVNTVIGPIVIIFSGNLIPLPLFPDRLQPVLALQPFAGLVDTPFRIYSGHLAGAAALAALARQAAWTLILIALGRLLMTRVMARVQVQGG
jgi:ABC-2 type transport system permease protein